VATLTIDQNPTITDTIVFTLPCPDATGCLNGNPDKVNSVVIYFVERDFASGNLSQYDDSVYDPARLLAAQQAQAAACASPTPENIQAAQIAWAEAQNTATRASFYYNNATPVQIVGSDTFPAWLSTDPGNAFLEQSLDANGNPILGSFTYTWQPEGVREGDYFICWTWTPLPAGTSISDHQRFFLGGNTQVTTSLPTHFTDPEKYPTLLERYLPEMFKNYISADDKTPDVLQKFNNAIAKGFTQLEDLANQIVDLQDANSIHEALIPYLANYFNLKLKSDDPTRWRAQIKRAVPLFKSKGTKRALAEALDHAGISLLKITKLWEVISSYTWNDVFTYDGTTFTWNLTKTALPLDLNNFGLWLRPNDQTAWIPLSPDYIQFGVDLNGISTVTWVGHTLSSNPIDLLDGDEIRVMYLYNAVPDSTHQTIENYVRSLPLMDQRDERSQLYPLKNWNVRLIAEDDPMFDVVIPVRHPYHEPLVYGKVRTEFPYSENIYNMEEYNGSIRNSLDPCDIDRSFLDPCTACLSSCYNIDLEIEGLSDDRVLEAKEVLEEMTPFHAVLFTMNVLGGIQEFIQSPVEDVEALVTYIGQEVCIAGEGQMWFNRDMKFYLTGGGVYRTDLANKDTTPAWQGVAVGYNDNITMFCPARKLDQVGMALDGSAVLYVKAPSPVAGQYFVNSPSGNTLVVTGAVEPIDDCDTVFNADETLNTCAFTFDLMNNVLDGTLCNITQDNVIKLADAAQNYGELSVQPGWTVTITGYSGPYTILDILPDNTLLLQYDPTLPTANVNGVAYSLSNGTTTVTSGTANLTVQLQAVVQALDPSVQPIRNVIRLDAGFYFMVNAQDYCIMGFPPNTTDSFYIGGYSSGNMAGVNLRVCQKVIENEIGHFSHQGMKLQLPVNIEQTLGIQNGANSYTASAGAALENDNFMENYLVVVNNEGYFMAGVNGDTITLSGLDFYWKTLAYGGTSVNVTINHYTKQQAVTIMGQQFDLPDHTFRTLDRNGRPVITGTFEDGTVESLSLPGGDNVSEVVSQTEGIAYTIQYADGTTEKGAI
jgi:hypothetical protein